MPWSPETTPFGALRDRARIRDAGRRRRRRRGPASAVSERTSGTGGSDRIRSRGTARASSSRRRSGRWSRRARRCRTLLRPGVAAADDPVEDHRFGAAGPVEADHLAAELGLGRSLAAPVLLGPGSRRLLRRSNGEALSGLHRSSVVRDDLVVGAVEDHHRSRRRLVAQRRHIEAGSDQPEAVEHIRGPAGERCRHRCTARQADGVHLRRVDAGAVDELVDDRRGELDVAAAEEVPLAKRTVDAVRGGEQESALVGERVEAAVEALLVLARPGAVEVDDQREAAVDGRREVDQRRSLHPVDRQRVRRRSGAERVVDGAVRTCRAPRRRRGVGGRRRRGGRRNRLGLACSVTDRRRDRRLDRGRGRDTGRRVGHDGRRALRRAGRLRSCARGDGDRRRGGIAVHARCRAAAEHGDEHPDDELRTTEPAARPAGRCGAPQSRAGGTHRWRR